MAVVRDPTPPVIAPQALVEVCFCHHARRTARAITRIFDEALQPVGLKASQFNILAMIAAHNGASTAEISRLLSLDRTTLSRNLKPLQSAGYLTAQGGAGRRPDALALTAAGRSMFDQAAVRWQTAQSGLTERLGAGQAGVLLQTLENAALTIG
ncbi:MAG: MarR family winged helix-turn-helix transcriptional regulator [Rhodospirillaceae bacterium]|nr:MarR family winged helix-turn-helix transcriptional regulator [Rhodospirillaceae bacterium]